MRIGIVTTWLDRGAAQVSKQFMHILEQAGNEVFIFARGGNFFAKGDKNWDFPNVTWNSFLHSPRVTDIDRSQYEEWLSSKKIQLVLFNEQRYWSPILWTKAKGIKTVCYVDYYTKETLPLFGLFDELWCNTKRHYSVFQNHRSCRYIPWGTNIEVFKPSASVSKMDKPVFFHSAGMSPSRKGTDLLIQATELLFSQRRDFQVVIHTQVPLLRWFKQHKERVTSLCKQGVLEVVQRTVGPPGLYHLGHVYVYPSRLDGIGLTIAEAMACGLPAIVTDSPPMSEFVRGSSGRLVAVNREWEREDGYLWPMTEVDLASLVKAMESYLERKEDLDLLGMKAREFALEKLNWEKNSREISTFVHQVHYSEADTALSRLAMDYDRKMVGAFIERFMTIARPVYGVNKTIKETIKAIVLPMLKNF